MGSLEEVEVECPNCGETIELTVDCSVGDQEYVEDCPVCCRPINIVVSIDPDGVPTVEVARDDE